MRIRTTVIASLSAVAAVLGAGVFWLFYSNSPAPKKSFQLDLTELRQAAASIPGAGPQRIEIERLSHTMVPKIAIVAGTSWGKIDMVRASYRIVFPDKSIIIDTANSQEIARKYKAARYDSAAWSRLVSAMDVASAIVVTHEHADHIGGLLANAHRNEIFAHAVLTEEQVADQRASLPLRWPELRALNFHPIHYDRIYPLAPGVVLIKAPGHTPGSQMVYVRRVDGREFLFMGDTASLADNIASQRIRSRYVTDWNGAPPHDDRAAVMAQTVAIHRVFERSPSLILVPGHDGQRMLELIKRQLLVPKFSGGPS